VSAIVTGGARGIGEAIARRLARDGVSVCVADVDLEAASGVAASIDGLAVALDVRDAESFAAAAGAAAERFGDLTILVNNAGLTRPGMVHKLSDADWDLVNDVVLRGAFNGFRAVAPWFRRGGSRRVVNISSVAGTRGGVGGANYSAAKAGVIGLTRAMADEWARFGVTVNAVAPGYVETQLSGQMPDALKADIVSRIPIGRAGQPEDVAAAVAFFCSDEAGFVTGQVLEVHGGLSEMTPPTASAPR
jgi:NAD(P)-dependent dehydrogenase (short-subunit alcohol dehydrogenase family)